MFPILFDIPLPFSLFGHSSLTIYSFGAMVAVAILTAAWLTGKDLDRLYREGRLKGVRVPIEEKNRKGRKGPSTRLAPPSALVGTMVVFAVVFGFVGAKFFHVLENLDSFLMAPGRMLFSGGGFTFYGGLIVAAIAIAMLVRKKGLRIPLVADAVAPGLMIGYGIGRIGCYLAGDGDWGICSNLANKPGWIPARLWSETFPNSILDQGNQWVNDAVILNGCGPLADGVYPTMLYEFAMALALFGVLWSLRRHPFRAGWLFSLYLFLNGMERFLIELIRVNNEFQLLGLTVTQAEVIATVLMLAGAAGMAFTSRRRPLDSVPADGRTTQPASV